MNSHQIPTILNVDNDATNRYAVTRILEQANFRVREAASGIDALRLAGTERPDVVLLDFRLPDMSGVEVCRRLRANAVTALIPVLHLTPSSIQGSDVAAGFESGADNYLVEPVEPEVLIAAIRAALRTRRAEESARALALEWEATFDAIRDGVMVVDAQGRIQRANQSMARLTGIAKSDLTGMACSKLWDSPPDAKHPFLRPPQSGKSENLELEYGGKLLSVTVDPISDTRGNNAGAVHIVRDVTERRQLEEQFREAQKFETVGTLAAGVAHDFNNLLTSIMGNASLVLGEMPPESGFSERLQDIVRASQRAADLTRQLLAYSGKGRHFMQEVELSTLVQRLRELIQAAIPKKVALELRLEPDLPRIEADANQIQQVILNLVNNAAEAIGEESGRICIETGGAGDTASVYLEVRDTGCGMDGETRGRIFDPFFTTKFTGRGLGLAAVAGIVRGHKGSIQVTSAVGQGSAFRVCFPARETAAVRAVAEPAPAPDKVTVLVVDDEEMVRRIAQASLETRGYKVLLASNGLEAIREIRRHPETSIVLLDLTMPVMGGEEAIDEIMAAHPGVKVLVSTGYDHREAAARFSRKDVAGFLLKPYTSRQLAEKIAALAGRAENSRSNSAK